MHPRNHLKRFTWLCLSLSLFSLLIPWTWLSASPVRSPGDAVRATWRRVQEAGEYHFSSELVETTHPGPALTNVGRTSRQEYLYLEGTASLPQDTLQMTMWEGEGTLTDHSTGVEILIAGDRAQGRQLGGDWQDIPDFSGAFAPGKDLMGYLAGAENVREVGTENHVLDITGESISVAYTHYTFAINGRDFAAYMRDQLEHYLSEKGELPVGVSLAMAEAYLDVTGEGHIWIDKDGLPGRLQMAMTYPEMENGDWIEAEVKTDFFGFPEASRATATLLENPRTWLSITTRRLSTRLDLPRTTEGWQRFGVHIGLTLACVGLISLLFSVRRTRRLYPPIALLIIVASIVSPVLQSNQVAAYNEEQSIRQETQTQEKEKADAHREAEDALYTSDWKPHANPANQQASESANQQASELQIFNNSQPTTHNPQLVTSYQLLADPIPDPTSDADNDGLTYEHETNLGTDPDDADSDGDGLTDLVEVRGFSYRGQTWYSDPNGADTNNDGRYDGQECPDRHGDCPGGNCPQLATPCRDSDGDGAPDLFDQDDDGDGVEDRVDLAPLTRKGTFSAANPFNLIINSDKTGRPLVVDLQLRPANPAHLTYARNVLDWPSGDQAGQVQRRAGNTTTFGDVSNPRSAIGSDDWNGDMRLVPMLEIEMSGNDLPLPLIPIPVQKLTLSGALSGDVSLTHRKSGSHSVTDFTGNLSSEGAYTLDVYEGLCMDPNRAFKTSFAFTTNGVVKTWDVPLIKVADSHHSITVIQGSNSACVDVLDIPNGPYEDQMFDTSALNEYAVSVQDKDENTVLAYVPLNVVPDRSGGGRVAFAARMLYQQNQKTWGNAHAVRLVWWVQMLTDMCQPVPTGVTGEAAKKWCDNPAHWIDNQPQVVVTYDDDWELTGISVREDERLDVAIVYPMTNRDQLNNTNMWSLAYGLEHTFIAGRDIDNNKQRDITVPEIAQRFDRDLNGGGSGTSEAQWNIPKDAFKVETHTFDNLDYIMTVPMTHTKAILQGFATTDTPTFLFAREEYARGINSDDANAAWTNDQKTLNLQIAELPIATTVGFQWAAYRYISGKGWQMYPMDAYMDSLGTALQNDFKNDPDCYDPNDPDVMRGAILAAQMYSLSVYNGVQSRVQYGQEIYHTTAAAVTDSMLVKGGAGLARFINVFVKQIAKFYTDLIYDNIAILGGLMKGGINLATRAGTGITRATTLTTKVRFSLLMSFLKTGAKAKAAGILNKGLQAVYKALKVDKQVAKLSSTGKVVAGVAVIGAVLGIIALIGTAVVVTVIGAQFALGYEAMEVIGTVISVASKFGDMMMQIMVAGAKLVSTAGNVVAIILGTALAVGIAAVQFIILLASGVNFSVAFSALNAGLASAMAGLILSVASFILSCTVVGLVIIAIIAAIDFLITLVCSFLPPGAKEWTENLSKTTHGWVNLCGGISGFLTRAATWGIYSNVKIVTLDDPNRLLFTGFDAYPINAQGQRSGFTAGNRLNVSVGLRNNLHLTSYLTRLANSWMAASIGWWQYNLAFLRYSTFKYVLSPNSKADVSVGVNQHYMEWRSSATGSNTVSGDFVNYDPGQWYITRDVANQELQLSAGINRTGFDLYLVEGYSVWLQECINGFPTWFGPIPFCYTRPEWGARPLPIGKGLTFDVFPTTLDGFYQLVAKDGGYALGWANSAALAFPRLKDADGDGLLNPAEGGADPNDLLWDTDGDGLSDFFETQEGTNPVSADGDGDGLNDREELNRDTDPFRADSDGDGLTDKEELDGWAFVYGFDASRQPLSTWVTSDPSKADTDDDTILDGREKVFGFNPRVVSDPTILDFETTLTESTAPQVLLRFEEAYGATSFSDLSGYSYIATCTGDACPIAGVDGQHGTALSFDGVNDHVDISDAAGLHANTFTLSAWFQWDGVGTNAIQFLTGKATENLEIHTGGGNAADVNNLRVIPAGSATILDVPNFIQPGWQHIAVTYNGNTTTVYRNGVQLAQHANTDTANDLTADTAPLRLGMRGVGNYPFAGDLDEVVIFNRVLSQAEIQTVMNARYTPNDKFVKPGDTFHYEGTVENRLYGKYAQGLLSLSEASQATFDMTPRNFILGPRETTTPPLSGAIQVQVNAASDRLNLTQIVGALISDPNEDRQFQYWYQPSLYLSLDDAPGSAHFQDQTGITVAQCQSTQCPATGVRGRINQAAWFDGQNDRISSATTLINTSWSTMGNHGTSVWFKTESGQGTLLKLFRDDLTVPWQTLYLQDGKLCTDIKGLPTLCTPGTYMDGQWHHLAYTYLFNIDGANMLITQALYVDGQNQAQYQTSDYAALNSALLYVNRVDIGEGFTGTLDEITIYLTPFNEAEITTLYQAAPQFQLYLDETLLTPQGITTTTFVDAAHGNNGVCGGGNPTAASCPNAGSEGQINLAASFDGVDDSIAVTPVTFNSGTVSVWYNRQSQNGDMAVIGGSDLLIGRRWYNQDWGGYWCGDWHSILKSEIGNTTGSWNHAAFVFDGANTSVYINGSLLGTVATGACDKTISYIGHSDIQNNFFHGRIDEVTVYNRPLSANEIAAIFQYQNAWVDEQETVEVWVDADAPVATISSVHNGEHRRNEDVVFQIDAYDPVPASGAPSAGLFKVEWRVNGGAWQEAPVCRDAEPGTAWCPTFTPTSEGTYTLEARGVDAVNNEGTPASVTVYVDATPPQATSNTAAGALLTVQPHPTDAQAWTLALSGSVSDPVLSGGAAGSGVASVVVTLLDATGAIVDEPTPATLAGSAWAVAYTLPEAYATGQYTLTVTTADALGNTASATLTTFNVDASAPAAILDADTLAPRALSDAQPTTLIPGQALAFDLDDAPGARTFQDRSGYNRDATCDGAACPTAGAAGRMAGALDFDGADDTVTVARANTLKISQFTLSAWFKWDDMGTANVQFLTAKGLENLEIHTGGGAGVNGIRVIPAGLGTYVDVANFIQTGWNHIAVTYDGTTTTVYRNGVAVGARTGITTSNDLTTDAAPLYIGNRSNGIYAFDGQIDEVHLFNRALGAGEVAHLAQTPLQDGQVMHLSLDEATGATGFSDTSGTTNNGVCFDAPSCPAVTSGQTGNALHFDGTDDSLYLGNDASMSLIGDMSFAAWINPDSLSGLQVLLSKGVTGEYEISFWDDRLSYSHDPWMQNECTFDYTFTPGVWTHIAFIRDHTARTLQLYVNGQLQADSCIYTDSPIATRYNVGLGSRVYAAWAFFQGAIDEAYLFNRALTADDVALLTTAAPAQSGATLHMSLDDRSYPLFFGDQSGNGNAATCSGDACPTMSNDGKYAAAFDFDGVDDTVTVADNATLRNPAYTLSAWFQWDDIDTDNIQFLTAKGFENLEIQTGGGAGVNGIAVIPAGYPETNVDAPNFIQPGWNHVAVTYDGSTVTVYRNGVQVAQRTGITSGNDLTADMSPFRLGMRGDGTYRFDGTLDDVRLYPQVLTPAEIAQLAGTLHGAVSELPTVADTVLHLPFEDSSPTIGGGQEGAIFRDFSGQYHNGTCSGTACPTAGITGQDGAALTFDGNDDVVLVADADALRNSEYTLSAWFQWDDMGTDNIQFLTAKGLENLEILTGGGAGVNGLAVIPAGYPETNVDVPNFIQPGWNHVAVTYDGDKVAVYRNGVLVGERSDITGGNDLTADTSPLRLGVRSDGTYRFDGALDDVRLFSRALTAAEVAQLAQAQVAGVNSVEVAFEPTMPGNVFYTEPQLPGQLLYLQLDDMPGQSETVNFKDVAGLAWDGTCSGDACPSTGAVGHNGQGIAFDGVNDFITIPDNQARRPAQFSLSLWFKWDDLDDPSVQVLIIKDTTMYELHTIGTNTLRFIPAGWPNTHVDGPDFIQPGWNHVVATYDGSTATLYRNGVQVAQRTGITGGANLSNDGAPWRLSVGGGNAFHGVLDDVRLFDRVLSPAEAAALWRGSEALLHLTFDDARIATGNPVPDSSGWQHDGMLLSASGDVLHNTTGHVGNGALTFDGVDDYVEIADTTALRPTAYTLSAWFQWDDVGTNNIQFLTGKTPGNFEIHTGGGNAAAVSNIRVIPAGYPASYVDVANFIQPGWNHIAVTYDGATTRVYRNGVLAGERTGVTGANDLSADTASFRLGLRGDGSYPFDGTLDDVQLYPRVLSETEIRAQVMRAWQAATVNQTGTGISRSAWSLVLPQGLEGSYRIAARGTDMFGQTDARALAQWEGAIDTLAPRVTANAVSLGYGTRYTGYAEDFNLDAASYHGPCPVSSLTRQTFAAPWYVALSGATERLTRISWSCDVEWAPPEVMACDTDGNCTTATTGFGRLAVNATTLAASIFTPTYGTVLTATTPISVNGAAYALNGLDALTVTVNSTPVHTHSWTGSPISDTWVTAWTPGSDGVYRLEATIRDSNGTVLSETMPITVYVDTQVPAIAIGSSVFTTTHYPPSGMLALTGLVTDATGVQSVEVSTNGADFIPATINDNTWRVLWLIGQTPDGATYTVTARVADVAGHIITATRAATVDLVTPAWVTVTQTPTGTTVAPGTLTLAWTASSDGSGLDDYHIQWTVQITETGHTSVTTHAVGGSRTATFPLLEGQRLEANLISRDTLGNETWQPIGPVYGETALTPDFVTFPAEGEMTYRGWMDLGCALVGSDTRIRDEADGGSTLNEAQNFYVTWDTAALRMTWTGADWGDPGTAGDGDLFIYLDTMAGGSDRAYNPYTGSMSNTVVLLPARQSAAQRLATQSLSTPSDGPRSVIRTSMAATATEQMQADYVVWVQDSETAVLLAWDNANSEWRIANSEWHYRFEREREVLYTDLLIPFSTLSVTNPATTALSLVAFASENDALRLWATMPARNALNSTRLLDTQVGGEVQRFALTHRYDWPSLGLGLCPNGTQATGYVAGYGLQRAAPMAMQAATRYSGADVRLQLDAEPSGLIYSVLEDNLFYIMDDVFEEWMDWDDVDAELCEWFPDDPECEREGEPPASNKRLSPSAEGSVDFNAQNSLDGVMDVDHPAVGNGDVITYTIHYANNGTETSTGLYADIMTWGPVRLPDGEEFGDEFGEYYWLELGPYDLAPSETLTLTFQGLIDLDFDVENSFGWATLDVIFYDDTGDVDDNQLDWFYVDHEVDDMSPGISLHAIPALIGPNENTVGGFVSDRSAVPTVTLQILDDYGRDDWIDCLDATPEDGKWSCDWDAEGAEEGDMLYLTAYATDKYGQEGEWAPVFAWYTFTVDATPPAIALSTDTLAALSDGLIGPDEMQFSGSIQDNRLFDTVEVCDVDGECDGTTVLADAETLLETTHTYDDIPATPMLLGAGTVCESGNEIVRTFNVTEDFVVADVAVGVNISHEYRLDVDVWLVHPDGEYKANILWYGTDAENYDVMLRDSNTIVNYADDEDHDVGAPYFDNEVHPDELLSMFYGLEAVGEWQLILCDNYAEEDDGAYNRSRLILTEATLPENTRATWDYTLSSEDALDGEAMTLDLFGEDSVGNRSTALALNFRVDNVAPVLTVTTALTEVLRGEALTLPVLAGLVSDGDVVDSVGLFGFTPSRVPFTRTGTLAGSTWQATLGYTQTGVYDVWVHAEDAAGNLTTDGPHPIQLDAPPFLSKVVTPTTDVPLGGIVTYTLTVRNDNALPLTGIIITDPLHSAITPLGILSGTAYIPLPGNTLRWGPLAIGGNSQYNLVFTAQVTSTASYAGATVGNRAYVLQPDYGANLSNNAVFTIRAGITNEDYIFLPLVLRNKP